MQPPLARWSHPVDPLLTELFSQILVSVPGNILQLQISPKAFTTLKPLRKKSNPENARSKFAVSFFMAFLWRKLFFWRYQSKWHQDIRKFVIVDAYKVVVPDHGIFVDSF